jgi:hypothetical protein
MPSAQADEAYMRIMLKAVGITGAARFDAYFSIYDDQEGVLVYILLGTSEYLVGAEYNDLGYTVGEDWEYWEFYATIDASGTIIIRHNDDDDILIETDTSGNTNVGGFEFVIVAANIEFYVDDLAYNDTVDDDRGNDAWSGIGKIIRRELVGVGSNEDFTPSPGTGEDNYTDVNDGEQDGDTTYVASGSVGHIDTHETEDMPAGWQPKAGCVRLTTLAKLDAGGSEELAPYMVDGGDALEGASVALTTGYVYYHEMMPTAPDGSEWTEANFNSAEFGYKSSA